MEKETLEEAAEIFVETKQFRTEQKDKSRRYCFIQGAKWQQERMYSEEEVIQLLIKFNQEIQEVEDVRIWFEQFKKK